MRKSVITIAAVAALGLLAAPTAGEAKKSSFAQKLGGFAKGVAKVGLQVAGTARRAMKKTFGQKLGKIAKMAKRRVGARMYPYTVANSYPQRRATRSRRRGKRQLGRRLQVKPKLLKTRTDTAKNSIRNIN